MEQLQQINLLLIILALLLIYHVANGYKVGMVKEIISFISLIFLCVLIALLGNALTSYVHKAYLELALMVFLLAVLALVHHFVKVVLFPVKLFSDLPIVHGVDKLLGILVGAMEPVVFLWMIYALAMLFDLGKAEDYINLCISDSELLTWLYEHNWLVTLVERFGAQFQDALNTYIGI